MIVHNPNNLPTISIADLLPTQGDLKDLTEANYKKLKNTIERRGFSYPVYVWEDEIKVLHLLDGHQRQRVLTTEGWNEPIPYLKVPAKDLQEAMARLLEITSQYATITQEGIDTFIAKYELNEAEVYEATSFDALTTYGSEDEPEVEEDEAPEVSSEPPVSQLGMVYQLGRHRVMCGDSTDKENLDILMQGETADMLYTDPPYNFESKGAGFLQSSTANMRDRVKDIVDFDPVNIAYLLEEPINTFLFFCNKTLIPIYLDIFRELDFNILVWHKTNPTPFTSNNFLPDIEYLLLFTRKGRVWNNSLKPTSIYSKVYSSTKLEGRNDTEDSHPTIKPQQLLTDKIKVCSNKGGVVLDLFLGSGSTLIACEQTDRTCYGMELDPKYVDVIRKRYAKFTSPDNELPENWEELTPAINSEVKAS